MEIQDIALKEIAIKGNYRIDYSDMPNLMNSIKSIGLLQPIGVKKENNDGGYLIIWGHRRYEAFKKLGYKTIPAVIFNVGEEELTEEEFTILQVNENYQKKHTSLAELGRAIIILKKTMSDGEIAAKLGMSKTTIAQAYLEANRTPKKWQDKVRIMGSGREEKEGGIPFSSSSKINKLRGLNDKQKDRLYSYVSKDEASGHEINLVGSLMRKGLDIDKAISSVEKYRAVSVRMYVDKKKWDELIDRLKISGGEFVINLINDKVPDLAFKNIAA